MRGDYARLRSRVVDDTWTLCLEKSNILSLLQFDEVLTHRPIVVTIHTTVRKRRVVRRALRDVKPRHIVVFVDRVEQAGRAVRMRAEQPAWLQ